jgi:hypothetical protein
MRTEEVLAKFEKTLANARGSEWRLHVCNSLPSRDRKGAFDVPIFASTSKVCPTRTLLCGHCTSSIALTGYTVATPSAGGGSQPCSATTCAAIAQEHQSKARISMRTLWLLFFAGSLTAGPLTFSMSGTFSSSQPNHSPYFAPDTAWALSFVVDDPPSIIGTFSFPPLSDFDTDYSDGTYTLNGSNVPLSGSTVYFYTGTTEFLGVCLDSSCDNSMEFVGAPIFTGPVTDPTLEGGSFPSTDTATTYYVISQDQPIQTDNPGVTVNVSGGPVSSSTPEPTTMLSLGGGLLALGLARRKRSSKSC